MVTSTHWGSHPYLAQAFDPYQSIVSGSDNQIIRQPTDLVDSCEMVLLWKRIMQRSILNVVQYYPSVGACGKTIIIRCTGKDTITPCRPDDAISLPDGLNSAETTGFPP